MDLNRKNMRALLLLVIVGVTLFVGLWHLGAVANAVGWALGLVSFFFVGLSIAFILNTPMKWVEGHILTPLGRKLGKRWLKIRRPLAVVLTIVLVLGLVALIVFIVIPELGRTFVVLGNEIPGFVAELNKWIDGLSERFGPAISTIDLQKIDWAGAVQSVADLLRNGAGAVVQGTFNVASSVISGVISFAVGVILAVYILLSKERLSNQTKRLMYAYLPEKRTDRLIQIGQQANRVFGNFLSGQFLEAVILGVLCFIGMKIFRFQFATAVSLLVGLTAVIPIFGAFIGWFIGAFMILVNQGFMTSVWFSLFFIILQQIEGNLIYPHVMGKSIMLPGMWVLVAATIGGNLAGIVGMLISVPLSSLVYSLLREAVDRRNAARGIDPEKLKA